MACSIVPDVDVIGFHFGVHYQDFWGHRGCTHSLLFASLLAVLVTVFGFRDTGSSDRRRLCLYFCLATASHGLLDAMTNGGLGVAFSFRYGALFSAVASHPGFTHRRRAFFFLRGLAILQSEVSWIWLPSALLTFLAFLLRRSFRILPSAE